MLAMKMTASSLLPVVHYLGYYCVLIEIGTPPQQIPLIIDTSSSHTYLNPPDQQQSDHNNEYHASQSSTFSWLTCMDEEYCNVCLGNEMQCAYHFAAEQMYIMAKDIIHLNTYSNNDDNSDEYDGDSSDDDQNEANYLIFGYNAENQEINTRSYAFQVHNEMNHGGILALNRRRTSFVQQLYIQHKVSRQFAHYFHEDNGYLAFGDDVETLINRLEIENRDIAWIPYLNQDQSSMYDVHLEQVTLSNDDAELIIFEDNDNSNENLNILTFDTGITGIGLNHQWSDIVLDYIVNQSDVKLVSNRYYPYCIDTDTEDLLDDIFNKLPNINIRLSANMIYIISPEQYVINTDNDDYTHHLHYQWCLDITFDWYGSVCLGSHVMQNYLIIYNNDTQRIGIYDKNINHQRQQNGPDSLELVVDDKKYIYALSLALVGVLVCLLVISAFCVMLLRKMTKSKEIDFIPKWDNNRRRNSVTIDELSSPIKISPQHIAIDAVNTKQEHLELDSSQSSKDINISVSSSISPIRYYDGNVKSIVYDRIIQPLSFEEEMDAI